MKQLRKEWKKRAQVELKAWDDPSRASSLDPWSHNEEAAQTGCARLSGSPHPGCDRSGAQMPDHPSLISVACLLPHSSACWGGSDGNKKGLFAECYCVFPGFPDGSAGEESPAMQETQEMQIRSLVREDPLEEGMATHSSILAWKKPHGQRSLGSYRPRGHKELDTTGWHMQRRHVLTCVVSLQVTGNSWGSVGSRVGRLYVWKARQHSLNSSIKTLWPFAEDWFQSPNSTGGMHCQISKENIQPTKAKHRATICPRCGQGSGGQASLQLDPCDSQSFSWSQWLSTQAPPRINPHS